jgi:hypothetical protein
MIFARSDPRNFDHVRNAAFAASIASLTSPADAVASVVITSSDAGFEVGIVLPPSASRQRPLMKSWPGLMSTGPDGHSSLPTQERKMPLSRCPFLAQRKSELNATCPDSVEPDTELDVIFSALSFCEG